METTIIINEQHELLPQQARILEEKFGDYQRILVPSEGWNKEERDHICDSLIGNVIFVSPIPGMIQRLAADAAEAAAEAGHSAVLRTFVFANDHRVKKELPNGKVISVTAQEGWYLE